MSAPRLVLLGPQRLEPIVDQALADVAPDRGPIAVVTAGWEEREREVEELREHVGREVVHLQLFQRAEDVLARDPELAAGLRERRERLRRLQELYRLRLSFAMSAARKLLERLERDAAGRHTDLLETEIEAAIEAVRAMDARHEERIGELHAEFEERWRPGERDAVARHRAELAGALDGTEALCIAGGHVAVLVNRLRLFDVPRLAQAKPIVAWSAGAMALGRRIVVFHDSPPQGPGNAEVFERGIGLYADVVPLPHAATRLRLDDPTRVALFARRFAPAACDTLDARARLDRDPDGWHPSGPTRRLLPTGEVVDRGAA